jgi:hypothetical protein
MVTSCAEETGRPGDAEPEDEAEDAHRYIPALAYTYILNN